MSDHLGTACSIADQLCREAIWDGNRAVWLGDVKESIAGRWEVVYRSVDGDLYGGTAGVSLFLTRLWSATGSDRYRRTAEGALRYAVNWHRRVRPDGSLYSGSAGVAAAMAEAATVFDSERLADGAEQIARDAISDLPRLGNDLISGRSGSIIALLFLSRGLRMPEAREAALELGRELARSAEVNSETGVAWRSDIGTDEPPLCGLAHGVSGPAYALGELVAAGGPAEYTELGMAALRYERAWFDQEESNWPDLREFTRGKLARGETPPFPAYWCHGAPGIGLARLRRYELTGERVCAAEAGAAIQNAEKHLLRLEGENSISDASLCHGVSALVELFLEAGRVFEQARFLELAAHGVDLMAQRRAGASGWPCGVQEGGENPSLMLGLAGIGMTFLRVAQPATAPVGLIYTQGVSQQRLIVQLQGFRDSEGLQSRARELVELIPGSAVERFSRRGRVLLNLPADVSTSAVVEVFNQLDDVVYAEPDVVDHATDS